MLSLPFIHAGFVFLGALILGIVLHELSHAVALRAAGVPFTMEIMPYCTGGRKLRTSLRSPVARVTPTGLPDDLSSWQLRAAAMMPLCLVAPFGLVLLGLVPDPFTVGDLSLKLATIAWLGCAVPSPDDFSLLWYPERAIAAYQRG